MVSQTLRHGSVFAGSQNGAEGNDLLFYLTKSFLSNNQILTKQQVIELRFLNLDSLSEDAPWKDT